MTTNLDRAELERQAARKVGRNHPDYQAHMKLATWFDQQAEREENDHNG